MYYRIIFLSLAILIFSTVSCASGDYYYTDQPYTYRHRHHDRYGNYSYHSHTRYRRVRYYEDNRYGLKGIDPRDWGRKIVLTPSMDKIWDTYEPKSSREGRKDHSYQDYDDCLQKEVDPRYKISLSNEKEKAKNYGFKSVEAWKRYKKTNTLKTNTTRTIIPRDITFKKKIILIPAGGPPHFLTLSEARQRYGNTLYTYKKETLSPYLSVYTHAKAQKTLHTINGISVYVTQRGKHEQILINSKIKLTADKIYWVGRGKNKHLSYLARTDNELIFGRLGSQMKIRYQF